MTKSIAVVVSFIGFFFGSLQITQCVTFTDINAGFPAVTDAAIAWGDYDNDGKLDIAIAGCISSSSCITRIYHNNGGGNFTDISAVLAGIYRGSLTWGDYDNDGDLDLALTGYGSAGSVGKIYRNDGNGVFVDAGIGLMGGTYSRIAWGDYDNDGDLDIALSVSSGTFIYRNDSSSFTQISASIPYTSGNAIAWGDYDSDGDLDLVIVGSYASAIVRNDGNGKFTDIKAGLPPLYYGSVAWGDYDNDGQLDLAIGGGANINYKLTPATNIYHNESGKFVDIGASIPGILYGSIVWDDYDNDGDMDLAIEGGTGAGIYRNDDGTFINSGLQLAALQPGVIACGDYDGDGRLDLAIAGTQSSQFITKILHSDAEAANGVPSAPQHLNAQILNGGIKYSWDPATDDKTPSSGLTYNLRIGRSPGTQDVSSGMADIATGQRRLPTIGKTSSQSWTFNNLSGGTYYWSVQAIDSAFAASAWSQEQSMYLPAITGHVKTRFGAGVSGVIVATDDGSRSTLTDSSGYYNLGVLSGWSGTIVLSKTNHWFDPASRSYSAVTADMPDQDYLIAGFDDANTGLGVNQCAAWGDYDGDGDLDFTNGEAIYRNDNGKLVDINTSLISSVIGGIAWGDYDNDGDLDLATSDWTTYVTSIYRNDSGTFNDSQIRISGIDARSASWIDYDNDGKLDLVLAGSIPYNTPAIKFYHNDGGGKFTSTMNLPGAFGDLTWADFDNDGDMDLIYCEGSYNGTLQATGTRYYRNDGNGIFTLVDTALSNLACWYMAAGDYDNDGDIDLAVSGKENNIGFVRVYSNDGNGHFTNSDFTFPSMCDSVAWGDYDNDGDLDLLVNGCGIFHNDNNAGFVNSGITLAPTNVGTSIPYNSCIWADYNNDGDLDILLGGYSTSTTCVIKNTTFAGNILPQPPTGLSAKVADGRVVFSWLPGSDAETPVLGLSYNVRVGTIQGGNDVISAMANASSGLRYIPAIGNAQKCLSWSCPLKGCPGGPLYWSVQSIDTSYAGSSWAPVASFVALPGIRGYVRTSGGAGVAQVVIRTNDGISAVTNADGSYALGVPMGWSGKVTASQPGYWFAPPNKSYQNITSDISTENYTATAQSFTKLSCGLPTLSASTAAWGDYDNDGQLDLALAGIVSGGVYSIAIYRNNGGTFTDAGANLPAICCTALAWGDYDNDGRLDLAMSCTTDPINMRGYVTKIFHNDGGGKFTESVTFTTVGAASVVWGDYDNDGHLDLATGSKILHNDNGTFAEVDTGLPWGCGSAWADYDNDGDLDLAIYKMPLDYSIHVYRSDNGLFVATENSIRGSSMCWGDYDGDGRQDILAGDYLVSPSYTRVYHNDGSDKFSDINLRLSGSSLIQWADCDNCGSLNIMCCIGTSLYCFYNLGNNQFMATDPIISGATIMAVGDYDGDNDIDLLAYDNAYPNHILIYRNDTGLRNTPPSAPAHLTTIVSGEGTTFHWAPSFDAQTASANLTYVIKVGTQPGKDDIYSGEADLTTGKRRIPVPGYANTTSWTLKIPSTRNFYWSVQAIDTALTGSAWAAEQSTALSQPSAFKFAQEGKFVACALMIVTAVYDGFFYVENADRTCGIRVESATIPNIGDELNIGGNVATNVNGERYIYNAVYTRSGSGSIKPLGLNNRLLGGGQYGLQMGVWGYGIIFDSNGKPMHKWMKNSGVNNIGLLITTWGKIKQLDTQSSTFVIDDGSGDTVKCIAPNGLSFDPNWSYVCIIGISSCEKYNNELQKTVIVRSKNDITGY
ncbi:FG-GAP-like repeat-containing protein [bacterium]|nr:FG-GAP-like repeat-containing protein [bacterium]